MKELISENEKLKKNNINTIENFKKIYSQKYEEEKNRNDQLNIYIKK